jgi:hypothetical protein
MTPQPIPTLEEAEAQIEAEWERDRQGALRFQAKQLIARHGAVQRDLTREQRGQERAEGARAERAEGAAKAWRKLYGRKVARQLEPWTRYTVVNVDGTVFACSAPDRIAAARAASLDSRGFRKDDVAEDLEGVELTKHIRQLDGVDPDDETLSAIERERDAREIMRARRQREKASRGRREERERREFGVTVSDAPDAD